MMEPLSTENLLSRLTAQLPTQGVNNGAIAWAEDGRKAGEAEGAGTGALVYFDELTASWKVFDGTGSGGGVTDHGALTGLGDDDHPHYQTPAEHTAIGDGSPHHIKYTDAEAIAAVHAVVTTILELDTDTTGAELTELADGSTTTLHNHDRASSYGVSLGDFIITAGSPVLAEVEPNIPAWAFSGSAEEKIAGGFMVPADYSADFAITLAFKSAADTTADVVLRVTANSRAAGEAVGSTLTSVTQTVESDANVGFSTFDLSALVMNPGEYQALTVVRRGQVAADTLDDEDMWLIAVGYQYTGRNP